MTSGVWKLASNKIPRNVAPRKAKKNFSRTLSFSKAFKAIKEFHSACDISNEIYDVKPQKIPWRDLRIHHESNKDSKMSLMSLYTILTPLPFALFIYFLLYFLLFGTWMKNRRNTKRIKEKILQNDLLPWKLTILFGHLFILSLISQPYIFFSFSSPHRCDSTRNRY